MAEGGRLLTRLQECECTECPCRQCHGSRNGSLSPLSTLFDHADHFSVQDDVVSKPFRIPELMAKIEKLMEKYKPQSMD